MLLDVQRDRTNYNSIRDGEPRTSTSTFTQLQSSVLQVVFKFSVAFVHRDYRDY